jgi:Na/Pi-cotransporter
MTLSNLSSVVSGLALLLFALRFLTDSLDREIGRKFSSGFHRISKSSGASLFSGLIATVFVQASSVTVITAMGFLGRGLISLESALLMSAGAAVGSSIKVWYGSHFGLAIGPLLLLLGALGILTQKDQRRRRISGIFAAIGITFLGLRLIEIGLEPLARLPAIQSTLQVSLTDGMFSILKPVLFGTLLTVLLQSSSSVLILITHFVTQGWISIPAAFGLILGANIGTTSTPLIAGFADGQAEAKRLSIGYFIMKTVGVFLVLYFFRTHALLFEDAALLFGSEHRQDLWVGAFHTWFNAMNAITWWLLVPALARVLEKSIPSKRSSSITAPFSGKIQKLLETLSGRALAEGMEKFQRAVRDLHWANDCIFHILEGKGRPEDYPTLLEDAGRRCEASIVVLDSVRDVAWRSLKTSEKTLEPSPEFKKKVLGLVALIAEVKNIEGILQASIVSLTFQPLSHKPNLRGFPFLELRAQITRHWKSLYSLENTSESLGRLYSLIPTLDEKAADVPLLFELAARLQAVQKLMGPDVYVDRENNRASNKLSESSSPSNSCQPILN